MSISCSIPCNLCGGRDVAPLSEKSRTGKPLRTVICVACGLVWTDPRPHDAGQFYRENYRVAYKNAYRPRMKHVLRAGKVALSRLEKIRSLLSSPKAVLDVGSGGGEFAYLLASMGHRVSGIEPNQGYAEYSVAHYGLTAHIGLVQDSVLPPDTFDVITMWHVLEHLEDPRAVLGRVRSWLKPDGALIVEVPNAEATCQSPKSTFHEAHLYNFNMATLGRLARICGFEEASRALSSDGGNLTMLFTRSQSHPVAPQGATIPGNCERISAIVQGHRAWRHALTLTPYRRTYNRLRRAFIERRETAGVRSPKHLLDTLYRNAPTTCSPEATLPASGSQTPHESRSFSLQQSRQ
ncbi:MAG: methyltransferase domain-containing protein [Nitrospira sp.]|nr:methyltransferase domain-containing protein [Nitrospira sp.]